MSDERRESELLSEILAALGRTSSRLRTLGSELPDIRQTRLSTQLVDVNGRGFLSIELLADRSAGDAVNGAVTINCAGGPCVLTGLVEVIDKHGSTVLDETVPTTIDTGSAATQIDTACEAVVRWMQRPGLFE